MPLDLADDKSTLVQVMAWCPQATSQFLNQCWPRSLPPYGICFKQHFDTRYLVFYNTSPPRMFLSLDLLWECRIQHSANRPLYVTSSYSTWIFWRGVSDFATDCPCGVWCRGFNHLPPACWSTFWKSNFKEQLGCRFDIMDSESYFFVFWHMQLYMSWYIRSFFAFTFLNILYFFKYSSTNIFYRRNLYTCYMVWLTPYKHHPSDLMIYLGTFVEVINIMWYIDVHIAINGLLSLFKQNDYNLLWYNDTGSRRDCWPHDKWRWHLFQIPSKYCVG